MDEYYESHLIPSDKLAKQSTSDSDTVSHFNVLNTENSCLSNSSPRCKPQKSQDKEKIIYNIISTELLIEKENYSIPLEIVKDVVTCLNNVFFKTDTQEYLRQNHYLIPLKQSTFSLENNILNAFSNLNNENLNEIYIKFLNIQNKEIYINKKEFVSLLTKSSPCLSRICIYDIKRQIQTINIYNYLARKYMNQISYDSHNSTNNDQIYIPSLELLNIPQAVTFQNLPLPNNVVFQEFIEIPDKFGQIIKIKRCFLKYLLNKILHGLPLPVEEEVCDSEGIIRIIEPDNINVYLKLVQMSNIGEILFSDDNRYFTAYDINSKKKYVNNKLLATNERCNTTYNQDDLIRLTSMSSNGLGSPNTSCANSVSIFKKIELNRSWEHSSNNNIKYIKMYDVQDNSFLIPEEQIIKIYQQLVNRENMFFKQKLFNDSGKELLFNINKMRSKPQRYYLNENCPISNDRDIPYIINNEENLSYFEVTNCLNGTKVLMRTVKIFSMIKNNIGKDFVFFDFDKKMKICIEELKDLLKIENKSKEYIKLTNVSNKDCYIKKTNIFLYIKKILANNLINDILCCRDNQNKQQYFDMKNICKYLFSVLPSPYIKDSILKQSLNTYIHSTQGFINVNHSPQNELFEYIKVEDENQEEFFIRKPFLRNIIYQYCKNNERLPAVVDITDLNHKKRRFLLRSYIKNFMKTKIKFGNIKIIFNIKEKYIEIITKDKKNLVPKNDLEIFIFENKNRKFYTSRENKKKLIKNIYGKIMEIDYQQAKNTNLKHEWILIKDINNEHVLVYKSILKGLICSELFETKNNKYNPIVEIYDYNCKKRKVDAQKIIMSYMFQKSIIKDKKQILIEVTNKNSKQTFIY